MANKYNLMRAAACVWLSVWRNYKENRSIVLESTENGSAARCCHDFIHNSL